jgi:hypothetical protein
MGFAIKQWKPSLMDLQSCLRWEQYTEAREDMFARTRLPKAPWHIVEGNDKKRVTAAFMHEGHYRRHLRRTKRAYAAKRQALLDYLQASIGIDHIAAPGLAVLLRLPKGLSDVAIAREVARSAWRRRRYRPGMRRPRAPRAGFCWVSQPRRRGTLRDLAISLSRSFADLGD